MGAAAATQLTSARPVPGKGGERAASERFQAIFDRLPEPKRLVWVEAEDHFFKGALDEFEASITGVL